MPKISPYALGATLYMPATRQGLAEVVDGTKLRDLRSLVICLEDAVAEADVDQALANLERLLAGIEAQGGRQGGPLLFVRPRHSEMARRMMERPFYRHVDGFVLPKLTLDGLDGWLSAVAGTELMIMPTLETPSTFDAGAMRELRIALAEQAGDRVLALRIGGNDLLSVLGLRRPSDVTIYDGPLGYVIGMLVAVMGSAGFALTGPVCERLDNPTLLAAEVARDVAHGLVGKTAIHPGQIPIIHRGLQVDASDHQAAIHMLSDHAPAVFQAGGAMCEPATHRAWARRILERARWFGIRDVEAEPALQPERIPSYG